MIFYLDWDGLGKAIACFISIAVVSAVFAGVSYKVLFMHPTHTMDFSSFPPKWAEKVYEFDVEVFMVEEGGIPSNREVAYVWTVGSGRIRLVGVDPESVTVGRVYHVTATMLSPRKYKDRAYEVIEIELVG